MYTVTAVNITQRIQRKKKTKPKKKESHGKDLSFSPSPSPTPFWHAARGVQAWLMTLECTYTCISACVHTQTYFVLYTHQFFPLTITGTTHRYLVALAYVSFIPNYFIITRLDKLFENSCTHVVLGKWPRDTCTPHPSPHPLSLMQKAFHWQMDKAGAVAFVPRTRSRTLSVHHLSARQQMGRWEVRNWF